MEFVKWAAALFFEPICLFLFWLLLLVIVLPAATPWILIAAVLDDAPYGTAVLVRYQKLISFWRRLPEGPSEDA
jgi:hypothetical protein